MNKNNKLTMPDDDDDDDDDDDVIVTEVLEIVGYTSHDHLLKVINTFTK